MCRLYSNIDIYSNIPCILFSLIYIYTPYRIGGEIFENQPSAKVRNEADAKKMWDYSTKILGLTWPDTSVSSKV